MSERGSFTTQFIYDLADYKIIRKALDRKSKYLCVSPPATCNNGEEDLEMQIVSGAVGDLAMSMEWDTIATALEGVVTSTDVSVIVLCESGSVVMVRKAPNGTVRCRGMVEEE